MKLATRVKPISYLKANAAEIINDLAETGDPMVITQNGEAKAIIQDLAAYERTHETLALLRILAMGEEELQTGKVRPVHEAFTQAQKKKR
jgi:prevent-host-death family protein